MNIEFDPIKDSSKITKHGISLARASEIEPIAYEQDDRFEEPRFRIFGKIDGVFYCLAGTMRGENIRVISLRRTHKKEIMRYVKFQK